MTPTGNTPPLRTPPTNFTQPKPTALSLLLGPGQELSWGPGLSLALNPTLSFFEPSSLAGVSFSPNRWYQSPSLKYHFHNMPLLLTLPGNEDYWKKSYKFDPARQLTINAPNCSLVLFIEGSQPSGLTKSLVQSHFKPETLFISVRSLYFLLWSSFCLIISRNSQYLVPVLPEVRPFFLILSSLAPGSLCNGALLCVFGPYSLCSQNSSCPQGSVQSLKSKVSSLKRAFPP